MDDIFWRTGLLEPPLMHPVERLALYEKETQPHEPGLCTRWCEVRQVDLQKSELWSTWSSGFVWVEMSQSGGASRSSHSGGPRCRGDAPHLGVNEGNLPNAGKIPWRPPALTRVSRRSS